MSSHHAAPAQFLRLILSALAEGLAGPDCVLRIAAPDGGPEIVCRSHADLIGFLYRNAGAPLLGVAFEDGGRVYRDAGDFLRNRLKDAIRQALGAGFSERNWALFQAELEDSALNEARAIEASGEAYAGIAALARRHGEGSLLGLLAGTADLRAAGHDAASLLVQLGSFSGHRIHPCTKTRLLLEDGIGPGRRPLTPAQFAAFAPEAGADVALPVLAVRASRVTQSTARAVSGGYAGYFAGAFPDCQRAWAATLGDRAGDFVPVPVHPLQLDAIRARLAGPIARGDIGLDTAATITQRPTISLRTFTPVGRPAEPQVKTTLAILMTSEVRVMSPARTFNAPVLSDLLADIAAGDPMLAGRFRVQADPAAVAWGRDPDPASADYRDGFHLGVILRENPAALAGPGEIAVPLTTLLSRSPVSGDVLLIEIMREAGVRGGGGALAWFGHYAQTVLEVILALLAGYGVGIEAHQQNTDMIFDGGGRLAALAYRDASGGMEIAEAMLAARGHHVRPRMHPFIRGLCETLDLPLQQTMHTTFASHLFPVAGLVAQAFGLPPERVFAALRERVETVLDRIGRRSGDPLSMDARAVIRRHILDEPVQTKGLLTMRVAQSHDVSFTAIANPLAR